MRKFRQQKIVLGGLTGILIVCLFSFFAMICCIPTNAAAETSKTACSHCQPVKAKLPCHSDSSGSQPASHCPMQEIVTTLKGLTQDSSAFIRESFQQVVFITPVELKTASSATIQHYSLLQESSQEVDFPPLSFTNPILRI